MAINETRNTRIKLTDLQKYSFFYQLNKELVKNPYYKDLSCEAKVLYAVMWDRLKLSKKNRWIDKNGYVYIYFTLDSVMNVVNCAKEKANKVLKSLREFNLIETERQGLNKPNRIYVLQITPSKANDYKPKSEKLKEFMNYIGPSKKEVREFSRSFGRKLVIDPDNFYYTMYKRGWKDKNQQTIRNWKALFTTWNNNAIKGGAIPKSEKGWEDSQKNIPCFEDSKFDDYGDYMDFYYPVDPDREKICKQTNNETRVGNDEKMTYTDIKIAEEISQSKFDLPDEIVVCPNCGSEETYQHGSDMRFFCADCRYVFETPTN